MRNRVRILIETPSRTASSGVAAPQADGDRSLGAEILRLAHAATAVHLHDAAFADARRPASRRERRFSEGAA